MAVLSCVWWNVQDLYPYDPSFNPSNWPSHRPRAQAEYDDKLDALADVLRGMPDGAPDLVMLGEVAVTSAVGGRDALDDLAARLGGNRGHYLCSKGDVRGITCGAIWDADKLQSTPRPGFHVVMRPADKAELGRPIVELPMFDRGSGTQFTVYLNHWTARGGDPVGSEPSRTWAAGRLISLLLQRLCASVDPGADPQARILVVGDFNDEPYSDSLTHGQSATQGQSLPPGPVSPAPNPLYATRDKKQVIERKPKMREPLLYNPSWRLLGQMLTCHAPPPQWLPAGSHRFDGPSPNEWRTFDQVLVSAGMLNGVSPAFQDDSLGVYCTRELVDDGGKPSGPSDHLPVCFNLKF